MIVWVSLGIVAAIAGIVAIWGTSTRCPLCGAFARHPVDASRAKAQGDAYRLLGPQVQGKPGFYNRPFLCKKCGHGFTRDQADAWMNTSKRLGEGRAIVEYKKSQAETGNRPD